MLLAIKVALLGLCAVSLVFVALKLILPLIWMHARGVGVEIPLPRRFAMGHPRLVIYLFVAGGSLLFLALVATAIWMLGLRVSPR